MNHIDLNCDLGEYEALDAGHIDAAIMPFISSCNIACGGHAGNEQVMIQSVQWAIHHNLRIGAHPSFPDRKNFGRQDMDISPTDLTTSLKQQILALKAITIKHQVPLAYIKPHGSLYNKAADDINLSLQLIKVIQSIDPDLALMGLAHSKMQAAAEQSGMAYIPEAFTDRRYTDTYRLQSRHETGAVISDFKAQAEQALALAQGQPILSITDTPLNIKCQSLCLHGDTPGAVQTAQQLNKIFSSKGIQIHG